MEHVLTITRTDDDRHTRFVGSCSCGWEHRDTAIIGYNDADVRIGITTRHRAHVGEMSKREMRVVINTPASELNRSKRYQRRRLREVRRLFRLLGQVRP